MPNKEMAQTFENFVEEWGLHNYYEQVNTREKILDLEEVVASDLNP